MLKLAFLNILRLFFYGNIFMAACAALWTAATYHQLSQLTADPVFRLSALTFCGTFVLYNLARFPYRPVAAGTTGHDRKYWLSYYRITVLVLTGVAAIAFFLLLAQLPLLPLWPLGLAGLLVGAYYAPLFQRGPFGLRMFGVTKNLVIGVVWALVTALLPVTLAGATAWTSADLWLLLIERTLFIYLLMLPFDVEDVDRDAEEGVRTIPRRQGLTFTRWLIGVLLAALAALQLIHYQGYLLGGQLLVSAYIGILLWLLQPRRSDLHFLGFWDGAIALQAVLMLVLSS